MSTVTPELDHERLEATARRRVNVGSGQHPLRYWRNLDADPDALADVFASVPPLPFDDASLDEIYAGHFLEHLTEEEAALFMRECMRCLVPGGRLGILVPDTREVMKRYLAGSIDAVEYDRVWYPVKDLNAVCRLFLYSTIQRSHHVWAYDLVSLGELGVKHGFKIYKEIDRFNDPRIPVGAWYQCGWDFIKPKV